MLKLIADVIFGIGYVVGVVKWKLGIVVEVPERYRRG